MTRDEAANEIISRVLVREGGIADVGRQTSPLQSERTKPLFGSDSHLDMTTGKDVQ